MTQKLLTVSVFASGDYLIIAPSTPQGRGFLPTNDQGRIGCVVLNSRAQLRVSRAALKLMDTIRRNKDCIGDIDWWECNGGVGTPTRSHAFSWFGPIHRVIHVPTCEAARTFRVYPSQCTVIPNRLTKEMSAALGSKASSWREPRYIAMPPKPLTRKDLVLEQFQIAAWGKGTLDWSGPKRVLVNWRRGLDPRSQQNTTSLLSQPAAAQSLMLPT